MVPATLTRPGTVADHVRSVLDMADSTARIPLHKKTGEVVAYTLVDADDEAWILAQGSWYLNNRGYVATSASPAYKPLLHRVLLGLERGDGHYGDHINGDRLDNRRANLRVVTNSENGQNRQRLPKNNTSGYRNVQWSKQARKWVARAVVNGRRYNLGSFTDVHEAGRAAAEWRAKNMFGSGEALEVEKP